jgi:hypothetical protein
VALGKQFDPTNTYIGRLKDKNKQVLNSLYSVDCMKNPALKNALPCSFASTIYATI